jgi:glycosyltransferase involved in cell wall biosynthesis
MPRSVIVIPCYNEAERLDPAQVHALLRDDMGVLLVDDGSRDRTGELIAELSHELPGVEALHFEHNRGKAEAVRRGLLVAATDADIVGFCDADFSTPPDEIHRLLAELERSGADVVTGARVARLGADIERKPVRHYLGRVFATAASLTLGQAVYDTQCGAKLFRTGPLLDRCLATPFSSRWAFDVELFGRLIAEGADILEIPLRQWHHVSGSKLGPKDMVKATLDLVSIYRKLHKK